jgi:hypothetical protein
VIKKSQPILRILHCLNNPQWVRLPDDREDPLIPEEDPDIIMDEELIEPPPYAMPPAGEGPYRYFFRQNGPHHFAPSWNVPASIVRKEILPAMNRNNNYLTGNNMEITGYSNGSPVIRQRPGVQNALGKIKFVFPNRYNIYLHDTPAKSLFENEKRAFSHGCIRIQRPFELASYLQRNDEQRSEEKIKQEMN